MAVEPIPSSYPRVTPYLSVDNAAAAIDFYTRVLDAKERVRLPGPQNRVAHAELEIGDGLVMLADEFPEMGSLSANAIGDSPVTVSVYVEDVDAVYRRALDAGATPISEVQDQFYGDRSGTFKDPFGHKWNIGTHVEDVSPEDLEKRMAQMGPPPA